jgi:hypothetical protein
MLLFATYSDHKFAKTKNRICKEAKDFGFDKILSFSPADLSADFIDKTAPYIHRPRGGGYWLWKAYVFKHVFDLMNEGDILVYLDAGCEINPKGKDRLQEYIRFMDANKGVFSFDLTGLKEYIWTNQATFDYFGIKQDNDHYNSDQKMATLIMFRKNVFTSNFVNEFYNIAITRPHLFSDDFNYSNHGEYMEHRHDQSILSILQKKHGIQSMRNEVQYERWDNTKNIHVPFLTKRIRDKDVTIKGKIVNLVKRIYYTFVNASNSQLFIL